VWDDDDVVSWVCVRKERKFLRDWLQRARENTTLGNGVCGSESSAIVCVVDSSWFLVQWMLCCGAVRCCARLLVCSLRRNCRVHPV